MLPEEGALATFMDHPTSIPGFWSRVSGSPLARAFWLGFLILLLQIPVSMIRGVVAEREQRRTEAVAEVSEKWGREQRIIGPVLEVPYEIEESRVVDGKTEVITLSRHAFFLPQELGLDVKLDSERRHRGIFEVPVHTSFVNITGKFVAPELHRLDQQPSRIAWDRARLTLYVSDSRGIVEASALTWGQESLGFEAGTASGAAGIHVPLGNRGEQGAPFSLTLRVRGSEGFYLAPVGVATRAKITADWPHPSFQGAWLPTSHEINAGGFRAEYSIPHLGRDYPIAWGAPDFSPTNNPTLSKARDQLFGVVLSPPIDNYRMAERATKYGILFLVLTFGSLWLFEVLGKRRIHSLQYLLIGAAMCMFFLLELALSEHTSFALAYALASAMVTLVVSGYSLAVLQERRRAATLASVIAALYGGIYILLGNEDFALLVGALFLFAALSVLMFLTRKIDWYARASARG